MQPLDNEIIQQLDKKTAKIKFKKTVFLENLFDSVITSELKCLKYELKSLNEKPLVPTFIQKFFDFRKNDKRKQNFKVKLSLYENPISRPLKQKAMH